MKKFIINSDKKSASYRGFGIKPEYFFNESGFLTSYFHLNRIDSTGERIFVKFLGAREYVFDNTIIYTFAIYYNRIDSKKLKLKKLFYYQLKDNSLELMESID